MHSKQVRTECTLQSAQVQSTDDCDCMKLAENETLKESQVVILHANKLDQLQSDLSVTKPLHWHCNWCTTALLIWRNTELSSGLWKLYHLNSKWKTQMISLQLLHCIVGATCLNCICKPLSYVQNDCGDSLNATCKGHTSLRYISSLDISQFWVLGFGFGFWGFGFWVFRVLGF